MLKVYTDGSCLSNPGPGGFAVTINDQDDTCFATILGGEKESTNNRMELTAIIKALEYLQESPQPSVIYTDSQWALHATEGSWKIKKNLDLVGEAQRLYRELYSHNVRLSWLPGHAGFEPNEIVDRLARGEAQKWT